MIIKIIAVFLGGAFGSVGRYGVYLLMEHKLHLQKFWGTMSINILGSFLIGLLWAALAGNKFANTWQLLLMTGFLGGFTTFSAFSLDILDLFRNGEIKQAIFYVVTSFIGSLVMVFCAYYLVKWIRV